MGTVLGDDFFFFFSGKTRSRGEETMAEMMGDGDDALLDSLVKTATQGPSSRSTPRDRKRSRHADRKSCKYARASFCLTDLFIYSYR